MMITGPGLPPRNPLSGAVAGIVGLLMLAGAFVLGLFALVVAFGVGLAAWLVMYLRLRWSRRRTPPGETHIEAEYTVVSRRRED